MTTPLALLSLLSLPLVAGLFLYRRRSVRRPVATLELWADLWATPTAGRRRERLERSAALWLALLVALLLALGSAGLRGFAGGPADHLVLVLDGRASLAAEQAGQSARDRLTAKLLELVRSHGPRARITLVESGPSPRLLGDVAQAPGDVEDSLALWEPGLRTHDLRPAFELARELAPLQSGTRPVLWWVSDRPPPEPLPADVGQLLLGTSEPNWAIVRAWRGPNPRGGERVAAVVDGFGARTRSLAVRLSAEGAGILGEVEIDGESDREQSVEFPIPAEAATARVPLWLELVLPGGGDSLELDNRVALGPRHRAELSVWVSPDAALRRQLGFGSDGGIERLVSLFEPAVESSPEEAHILVGPPPAAVPGALVLEVGPAGGDGEAFLGPFLVERAHPLMDGVELRQALWTSAGISPPEGAQVLVSTGNHPLLWLAEQGSTIRVGLDLDPARSPWLAGPDWPILLSNLARWRRERLSNPERVDVGPGEPLTVDGVPPGLAWFEDGSGWQSQRVAHAEAGLRSTLGPRHPAAPTARVDGAEVARFGVALLDAPTSDLGATSDRIAPPADGPLAAGSSAGAHPPLTAWLLLVSVGVLLLDLAVAQRAAQRRGGRG